MRLAMITFTAALLASGVSAQPAKPGGGLDKQCQPKVDRCMSLCLRHNPRNVCRRYCKPDLICKLR
jgi:hypothetical protein